MMYLVLSNSPAVSVSASRPGISDEQVRQLFDAASGPKELKWYDTSHDVLDIAAISDRARFLAAELNLRPIEPILKRKIGLK